MRMRDIIVITRPQPEANDYALELQAIGFRTFVAPMLSIEGLPFRVPDLSKFDGIVLTSAQAMHAFMAGFHSTYRDINIYCVGKHTAEVAKGYGFEKVVSVNGTGQDLVDYVIALTGAKESTFLHIRGRDIAFPIAATLEAEGITAEELIVYEALAIREFSSEFLKLLNGGTIAAVTFFSKRTADAFQTIINENELSDTLSNIKVLSISARVLECVRVGEWADAYVSKTPDRAGMLKILKSISLGKE